MGIVIHRNNVKCTFDEFYFFVTTSSTNKIHFYTKGHESILSIDIFILSIEINSGMEMDFFCFPSCCGSKLINFVQNNGQRIERMHTYTIHEENIVQTEYKPQCCRHS